MVALQVKIREVCLVYFVVHLPNESLAIQGFIIDSITHAVQTLSNDFRQSQSRCAVASRIPVAEKCSLVMEITYLAQCSGQVMGRVGNWV